jgi:hypothetical protein
MTSTPEAETATEGVVAPVVATTYKVSVPAPPTTESPDVRVASVASMALNVSLPAPPVKSAPVSKPVVSVQLPFS